jgi:alpha-tubulin suppressor-like RCC1 family protein
MSMRFTAAINKPGFNPLGTQTNTTTYYPYLYTWGVGGNGVLGLGNTTYYSSPKQVGSLTDWASIIFAKGNSANAQTAMAIKKDGTLWGWGKNTSGMLGFGNTTSYSSPKQVGALTNWSNVVSGTGFTVAVKTDGTIWTWGKNDKGQLGRNNTTYYSSPKQLGTLTNWSSAAASAASCVAIKTDGTAWSWGVNTSGELGLSSATYYFSSPKQIGALTTWRYVSAGQSYFCAIKTDGTLWSWGRGAGGATGLGTTSNYSSPVQIGALTTWLTVAASYARMTLAVKTDGTLWSWGTGNGGGLGLGNQTNYSSPKQIGALNNWLKVAAGGYLGAAVKTDGTLWTWGLNYQGQLGNGNVTARSSPAQVGALTTWLSVSAGYYMTAGLLY